MDDLVGRLTLEEKVGQMVNEAPAIERLGIPQYNWWNEALHGVARAGLATVFPQAIGLAASWDEDMMLDVATTISDEARAKHHEFVRNDKRYLYQGLTMWSPNINIFRDPRWGRGQETYGEDPFLTGRMAVQFVRGLQGDDLQYLKTVATVKHFAVHNGPEPLRHEFNVDINQRDLWETYLPHFEMAVREAGVYSAMCAYNSINGEPACGNDNLLNGILRNDIGFGGYIVSDCGAIEDIYNPNDHGVVETPEEAAAMAVKSGTDLNCGLDIDVYPHLVDAVKQGLITEEEINKSTERLFKARFKLGMFDPNEQVEYAQIPYSEVDSRENREQALEAARKSMVLLKNDDNTLPLSSDLDEVAVIGPNSDQWLMLLGNYYGVPSHAITPLEGIRNKLPDAKVTFAQGSELAAGMPMYYTIPGEVLRTESGAGVNAEYFDNRELIGEPVYTETVKNIDANWSDKAPREDLDEDNFGVRWTTTLTPEQSGTYRLGFISTSQTKLFINDSLVTRTSYHYNNEYGDPRLDNTEPMELEAGKSYDIRVEMGESYADAMVQLVWAAPKPNLKEQALANAKSADAVVMFMGLTSRMEGEEMDIKIDGFKGGDRTNLDLPEVQLELIREVQKLGKPMVLVLLNGSALAVNWSDEHVPAILEAWYPGQAAGTAIADVLFGDYNPAGRLPVTFYKSVEDLPPFDQYEMTGHTYRYFDGEPLYPFGYGLSYTSFEYSNLKLKKRHTAGDEVPVTVMVTNTGDQAGEEVVQLYLSQLDAGVPVPKRSLKQFDRIHLEPGESKTVDLTLPAKAFLYINEDMERVITESKFEISVGGGQPGYAETLQKSIRLVE